MKPDCWILEDQRYDVGMSELQITPDDLDGEKIRFSRVLRPHRSSSDRAIKIISYFICLLFGPTALLFFFMGAWPVTGIMGLEVLGLLFALRYNHKVGAAFEVITITEREFRFSKIDHWGKRRHWTFQPQWLQVRFDEPSKQLIAGVHGKRIVIGKFLNIDEREALCATLIEEIRLLNNRDFKQA